MRVLHPLVVTLVAFACAAPACDSHEGAIGSGSGSSAWSRMPSPSAGVTPPATATGSATGHQNVVHAMETVTGAPLEPAASPTKPARKRATTDGGRRTTSSAAPTAAPPPPKKPELPERGRRLGDPCSSDYQCASDLCEFQHCTLKRGTKLLPNGEKCDRNTQCASNYCFGECQ
jgi:hypothetical protein